MKDVDAVPRSRRAWWVLLAALAAACDGPDEQLPPNQPVDAASIDVPIDVPTDANAFCTTCTADQICVQFLNGTCGQISLECVPRHATCAGPVCSPECMRWQCNNGSDNFFFRCDVAPCAVDAPGALHCYGP
jgi:hypothetical protein